MSRIVVTAAVVRRAQGYLVTRRPRGVHLENLWEFPGGKCEPGETHEHCLRREIDEELGVGVHVERKIFEVSHAYEDRVVELHFFECELLGEPNPRLGQDMRWVPADELGSLEFPAADERLIEMLRGRGTAGEGSRGATEYSGAGYAALRETAGWLDRSARGRLKLTGNDRRIYLQGILTNDIAALTPGTGCYSAMLTPNGRMLADMRVLELGDAILIDLPASVASLVRDRLEQFIFSEDVALEDVSASISQVGVYGPAASEAIATTLERLRANAEAAPDRNRLDALEIHGNVRLDAGGTPGIVAKSDDYGIMGFEAFIETSAVSRFTSTLDSGGFRQVAERTADVIRIESGRPVFGEDMDENVIPLEAGIEDRAISHTKGCYVGQEIIIRVLHRGHGRVARRLIGFLLDGMVGRGDRVHSGEREVGFITSVAHSPALGRPVALGYVHRDFVEPGTRLSVIANHEGVAAKVASLPFVPPSHASVGP